MKNNILFVIYLLFSLMFINSGFNKFFNYMPMPVDLPETMLRGMAAFNEIGWLMPLVAIAEIVGAVLFIIPKFRALGAIILFPIIIGITLTHIFQAPSGLPIAAIFLVIDIWVIWGNRYKYLPMIG